MSSKHAAICRLTFYQLDILTITSAIGSVYAKVQNEVDGVVLAVSAAELAENRPSSGSFVDMEFNARITDTSSASEDVLSGVAYRYGVCILDYTDGSRRLLGTNDAPIMLTYEKSGVHSAFELSISARQPEYAKIITA